MEYYVVREEYLDMLEINVNARIKEGWKPLGGVCIGRNTDQYGLTNEAYCQAMIKEE